MGHQKELPEFSEIFWAHAHEFDVRLTGTYPEKRVNNQPSAEEVLLALKFWRGIRAIEIEINRGKAEVEDLRLLKVHLLQAHRFDERPLVALVAIVELLPTKVWRRALWHYNIDFQSFESFLRRITSEQIRGLQVSLNAIQQDQTPLCFREGWKNVVRRVFRPSWMSVKRLTEENPEDRDRRYESKGAMAYEFFNVDFGHVRYRHEHDELAIAGSLATRFLSKKHHDRNDFVVNQEDGAYWWMYQTARSNYIWHPNKEVKLKQAICPGFWYTLFVWWLVLFGSPLAAAMAGIGIANGVSLWFVVPAVLVGTVTPLIMLVAVGKYALSLLGKIIELVAEKSGITINEDYWEDVFGTLGVVFFCSIAGAIIAGVCWIMYHWFYESEVLAIYMTAFLFLSAVHLFRERSEFPEWRSWTLPILGLPTMFFVLGKVIFDSRELLWQFLAAVVSFLTMHFGHIALWVMITVAVASPFVAIALFDKWERRMWQGDKEAAAKLEKLSFVGKVVTWIVMGLITLAYLYVIIFVASSIMTFWSFVGTAVVTVSVWLFYTMTGKYQLGYLTITQNLSQASREREGFLEEREREILRAIAKNEWLRSQSDYSEKAWWLLGFIRHHFNNKDFPMALIGIDAKGFSVAKGYNSFLWNNSWRLSSDDMQEYVQCMLKGIPVEDAERMIEAMRVHAREVAQKWELFYDATIGRFIVQPCVLSVRFVTKMIRDAHTMWQTLNESCPYWMEPRQLDRNEIVVNKKFRP